MGNQHQSLSADHRVTPEPNAYKRLLSLDQDKDCLLRDAIDVDQMLSDILRRDSRVGIIVVKVEAISKDRNLWNFARQGIKAERIVLAQSSHPKPHDLAKHYLHLTALDLDRCLKPSALRTAIPAGSKVGVVGSSHSAILILKSLYEPGNVSIANFSRSPPLMRYTRTIRFCTTALA